MERTKKAKVASELITWKKMGGGSFLMKNRIIKPGQVFQATLEDIPEGFRDVIVPVDPAEAKVASPEVDIVEAVVLQYFLRKRSAGYFDVVDIDGKVQNEKALREGPAEELIKSLQG